MSAEIVHDADAALTAQLHLSMEQEARAGLVIPQFYRQFTISGPTLAYKVSKHPVTADAGAITDGTALSNTGINPTEVTITAAGVGLKSVITGFSTMGSLLSKQEAVANFGRALVNKMDVDGASLLDNLNGACGTSAQDLGVGDFLNGLYDLREANEFNNVVAVLDPLQVFDLQNAISTSSAPSSTLFAGILGAGAGAFMGTLFGVPIYASSNVVDDSTDKIGGIFSASRALGWAWKWTPTVESISAPEYGAGSETIVVSACYGFAEIHGAAGSAVKSGNT